MKDENINRTIFAAITRPYETNKNRGNKMKTKNFPQKKLIRQLRAEGENPQDYKEQLDSAKNIRTKKDRRERGRKNK